MSPMDLFNFLTPESDDDPKQVRGWRNRIAMWGTLVSLSLMGAPFWAEHHFLTAAQADEIHKSIQKDIGSIKGSIEQLVKNDEARTRREKQQEVRNIRTSILDLQHQACMSTGPLRVQLNLQVGELRSQYMELTGEEFPEFSCNDLLGTQ